MHGDVGKFTVTGGYLFLPVVDINPYQW